MKKLWNARAPEDIPTVLMVIGILSVLILSVLVVTMLKGG